VCTANFTLRILSEDVIELPELNINKTYLQNSQSGKDYEDILEGMYNANQRFKWLDEEIKRMTSGEKLDRESIMLLKTYQKEKNELRIAKGSNVMKLNRMNSINKIGDAIKAIEEQIRKGEKVAVFSYFTDVVLALYTHFGSKAVLIDGSVNSRTRMDFINKFHKDPKIKLFIGQHTAAGAGINLYNACKGFVMDLPFVPSVLNQIVKRLHRRGQVNDVDFNLLMVKDSIDDHIFNNILAGKDADTNEILDKDNPKVVALRELGNKELVFDALVDNYKLKKELA
jgi:SNF2 family DNA or RNA helicase